ncbi:unnamed protein product [Danaus chrysippus]|uniref:(African queen) hypothetical protein n=1 Tax=Danaus chrysippus TaxID=151541 RepID=A0A8J2VXT0_9NEOP|nr:unnamed protein product [Danaus chrysippus]
MMLSNMYIILLCFLKFETYAISVDYYGSDDSKNEKPHDIAYNRSDSRRTMMNATNITADISDCSEDCDDDVDEKIIISFQIDKRPRPTNTSIPTLSFAPDNSTCAPIVDTQTPDHKIILKLDLLSHDDYADHKVNEPPILRNEDNPDKWVHNMSKMKDSMKTDALSYGIFYNLEPAADKDLLKGQNKRNFTNIWYVPQDLPCWELPLVYGELGERKDKSKVFLTYNGKLINVYDPWIEARPKFKVTDAPISHFVNKWCGVQPCFGDHTLCLFPNKDISNVCDKGYTVKTPNILDQSNIINTINTMRNRIANGLSIKYAHLPTAANMKQIIYDYDLQKISEAWLRQCLPGAAPCSALDGKSVTQLECTKYSKFCCLKYFKTAVKCTPRHECFIDPVIGCLHIWFSSAGKNLTPVDVSCGHTTVLNFNTVQLLWAKTAKLGCAYGIRSNGDVRIVCNFSPGAPFILDTQLYCGIIAHNDLSQFRGNENLTDLNFLSTLGIKWNRIIKLPKIFPPDTLKLDSKQISKNHKPTWGVDSLTKIYEEGWVRKNVNKKQNGTKSMIARLVAKFVFIDNSESKCDTGESVYEAGEPGSKCTETGATYNSLCYDFKDPTPGYRLIAVAAPITLFSLILYDLFSGVVRQTNY